MIPGTAMHRIPYQSAPPPPWFPMLPPEPPNSSAFWRTTNVHDRLRELQDTLNLAKSMQEELETLIRIKDAKGSVDDANMSTDPSIHTFVNYLKDKGITSECQESLSAQAAHALMTKLRTQLEPFGVIVDENCPWEEKSIAIRLADKMQKSKRNKLWRKRKRKRIAERLVQERERFDQADQEADDWRAREIARDIAKRKVEKMKEIAKVKAKEERMRLESELELVLVVEKLQELRSIRIQKLKKQGHFLPEEDDKFLERVRAAVEEEERQALAAAVQDAAKDAIATAEESRKTIQNLGTISKDPAVDDGEARQSKEQIIEGHEKPGSNVATEKESSEKETEAHSYGGAYDAMADLPLEFYHYYHGSSNDMGTLIEVRRTWDAYIRAGGSCIPGHWVQPPRPADEVWATYLVGPKGSPSLR